MSDDLSSWRIALYYCYVDLTPDGVAQQIKLHRDVCEQWDLKGRIRISVEGLNGVLSGRYELLQHYEEKITDALRSAKCDIDLDVKYCRLRSDISLESQLFDTLIVKKTSTVISLFGEHESNQNQKRKRKTKKKPLKEASSAVLDGHAAPAPSSSRDDKDKSSSDSLLNVGQLCQETMKQSPSPHLTPGEWNRHLQGRQSDDHALLLDVRNVYESRVGHFASPTVPTLLTNTRKYSDLPKLLATHPEVQEKKDIYMYWYVSNYLEDRLWS